MFILDAARKCPFSDLKKKFNILFLSMSGSMKMSMVWAIPSLAEYSKINSD
ncbi:MAG: hypothetical protein SXA11_11280 [Cyanobacteriota bacterium]|nr:hypothetical protein [Cyanobacteriota bacterium]